MQYHHWMFQQQGAFLARKFMTHQLKYCIFSLVRFPETSKIYIFIFIFFTATPPAQSEVSSPISCVLKNAMKRDLADAAQRSVLICKSFVRVSSGTVKRSDRPRGKRRDSQVMGIARRRVRIKKVQANVVVRVRYGNSFHFLDASRIFAPIPPDRR